MCLLETMFLFVRTRQNIKWRDMWWKVKNRAMRLKIESDEVVQFFLENLGMNNAIEKQTNPLAPTFPLLWIEKYPYAKRKS